MESINRLECNEYSKCNCYPSSNNNLYRNRHRRKRMCEHRPSSSECSECTKCNDHCKCCNSMCRNKYYFECKFRNRLYVFMEWWYKCSRNDPKLSSKSKCKYELYSNGNQQYGMFNNIKCNSDYSNAITSSNNQWNRSCVCRNKHYFDSKFRI